MDGVSALVPSRRSDRRHQLRVLQHCKHSVAALTWLLHSATYMFTHRAVLEKAPKASGVYSIFTAKRWVYVGESDDIQRSLFNRLNGPTASCSDIALFRSHSQWLFPVIEKRNWTR